MKPSGNHIIAEFLHCGENILDDRNALEELIKLGIEKYGLHLERMVSHKFSPIGVTAIAIISESHIAIHTYPEAKHASVDVFTCSAESQPAMELMDFFKEQLKPRTIRYMEVVRGYPLERKHQDWITTCTGEWGYEVRYHVEQWLMSKRSAYQLIDIVENEVFGRMLFLDNDLQIAEHDAHIYNASMVEPLLQNGNGIGRVAILGGGDGGVLNELLKHDPKSAVLVDIDGDVIEASREHLPSICEDSFDRPNVDVVLQDANDFLKSRNGFDSVIYDLTMHPEFVTTTDRETYLSELFARLRESINDGGTLSMQCCSEYDDYTLELTKRILAKDFGDIAFTKAYIPSFCEHWVFASATAK